LQEPLAPPFSTVRHKSSSFWWNDESHKKYSCCQNPGAHTTTIFTSIKTSTVISIMFLRVPINSLYHVNLHGCTMHQ
jgi:hypothetical protein